MDARKLAGTLVDLAGFGGLPEHIAIPAARDWAYAIADDKRAQNLVALHAGPVTDGGVADETWLHVCVLLAERAAGRSRPSLKAVSS